MSHQHILEIPPLRTETFEPFIPGKGPKFGVNLWDTCITQEPYGHRKVAYQLLMFQPDGTQLVLFQGDDYSIPKGQAVDSDESIRGLMGFLTMKPGDTDDEYFLEYTRTQLDFARQYGEDLDMCVRERFGEED